MSNGLRIQELSYFEYAQSFLGGEDKDVREMEGGPNFNVPGPASNVGVHF